MKIRRHRGGLQESLDTTVEIESTREAVRDQLNLWLNDDVFGDHVEDEDIEISFYAYDNRISDYVYMIRALIRGTYYPVAWCNENPAVVY